MSTTMYAPDGVTTVSVADVPTSYKTRLLARGWSLTPITPPTPPSYGATPAYPLVPAVGDPDTWYLGEATVAEEIEAEDTSAWPDRLRFYFQRMIAGVLQTKRLTVWFNEFFEIRGTGAKTNTTVCRFYVREFPADPAHSSTVPVLEVADDRTNRNVMFGIMGNGDIVRTIGGVLVVHKLVIVSATDPGVANTPWLDIS
jgi:hypothetical protein